MTDTMLEPMTSRGGRYFSKLGKHGRCYSEFFVKVIAFAMDLRDNNGDGEVNFVGRTFKRATRLLPAQVQSLLDEMYRSHTFPSPATISRANLYIDVAFMRVMASRHEQLIKSGAIFLASPTHRALGGAYYKYQNIFASATQKEMLAYWLFLNTRLQS